MSKRRRTRDKWRQKNWYKVVSPPYFGGIELGFLVAKAPSDLLGRVVDATLYDITRDFTHQYLKMFFRITEITDKTAETVFTGHEYSAEYLRSLVRRRTMRVDGIMNITTKDRYRLRLAISVFTLNRIKTSQEREIRSIIRRIVREKAEILTFDQYVQEVVLGKIASDIYNEAKKIAPLRHVGARKSKLLLQPSIVA